MSEAGDPTDAELARRVAHSPDPTAERELCRRWVPRIRLFAVARMAEVHAVDDLVQDVLFDVIDALRRGLVRDCDRIGGYVLGVSRNKIREHVRARTTHQVALAAHQREVARAVEAQIPPLRLGRLEDCLSGLDARERQILRMTFLDGLTSGSIGVELAMTAENVRVQRHRALERLRRCVGVDVLEVER
jgi:RNA polymerase sigma-70 factor (ECF subfamily)